MGRKKHITRPFNIQPADGNMRMALQVFNLLKEKKDVSAAGVSNLAGVSEEFANAFVGTCIKEDLLNMSGSNPDGMIGFNAGGTKVLGVGFSRGKCLLTVSDLSGNILEKEKIGIDLLLSFRGKNKELKEIIGSISDETSLSDNDYYCAGLAVSKNLQELNYKSAAILGEGLNGVFKCHVFVAEEATASGYAEKEFGAHSPGDNFLYMHSDVGIGVVIKQRMIFEANEQSEEKERAYLRPWGQYSVVDTAKKLVDKGLGSKMVNMVDGNVKEITLDIVLKAAENSDELAEDIVKMSSLSLGVRVAYLVNIFDVDVVVVGGGTEKSTSGFVENIEEGAKRFLLKNKKDLKIVPAVLGEEASSVGVASLCLREIFMEVLEV